VRQQFYPNGCLALLRSNNGQSRVTYTTLKALTPLDDATLQERLAQLVEAELLYQRGRPPRAHYVFKHALIQDVAYASLLKSSRQHYHQQIAQLFAR